MLRTIFLCFAFAASVLTASAASRQDGKEPRDMTRKQADVYRQAFEIFLRHRKAIGRVTFWGTHDAVSWLNFFPIRGRTEYPLLFDRQGRPKPAFTAVEQAARAAK
jgi:endo-1,4-beta-xylanase